MHSCSSRFLDDLVYWTNPKKLVFVAAVVISVGFKRRVEIDEIDTRIWKLALVAQPFQIVAKIKPVHPKTIIRDVFRLRNGRYGAVDLAQRIADVQYCFLLAPLLIGEKIGSV